MGGVRSATAGCMARAGLDLTIPVHLHPGGLPRAGLDLTVPVHLHLGGLRPDDLAPDPGVPPPPCSAASGSCYATSSV
jgi:hypothetical protein